MPNSLKIAKKRTQLVVGFLAACLFSAPLFAADCAVDRADLRGSWGHPRFSIEVADTDETRARGLMYRESLGATQGMLFIYEQAGNPTFWMKNTLIPLDMVFLTPAGVVQHVHAMARPHDLSPISGGQGVSMVLEIRGGMAAVLGSNRGSELRHPSISSEIAIWTCPSFD